MFLMKKQQTSVVRVAPVEERSYCGGAADLLAPRLEGRMGEAGVHTGFFRNMLHTDH